MDFTLRPFFSAFCDMQRAMAAFEQPLLTTAGRLAPQMLRYPPTDILETPEAYELYAELPSYDKKHIKIELAEDRRNLILSGSLENEDEVEEQETGNATAESSGPSSTERVCSAAKREEEQKEGIATSVKEVAKAAAERMTGEKPSEEKAAYEKTGSGGGTQAQRQVSTRGGQQASKSSQQRTPQWWVNERLPASFTRSYTFPVPIKAEGIKARFENGILKIWATKDVETQPKQIKID